MGNEREQIDEMMVAKRFFHERKKDALFLIASVFLGVFLEWDIVEIAIFSLLVWSIIGPISMNILAAIALFFLSIVPFLLVLSREDQAEQYAVYAYYFLVMTVVRGIAELKTEERISRTE